MLLNRIPDHDHPPAEIDGQFFFLNPWPYDILAVSPNLESIFKLMVDIIDSGGRSDCK